jgi:hypothetical protein
MPLPDLRFRQAPAAVLRWQSMQISDVYLALGEEAFGQLIHGISIGRLKTYQMYEGFKVRAHLPKVNTELLRKAVPRFWARASAHEEDFSKDLGRPGFFGRAPRKRLLRQGHGPPAFLHGRLGRARSRKIWKNLFPSRTPFLYQSLEVGTPGRRRALSPGFPECGLNSASQVLKLL